MSSSLFLENLERHVIVARWTGMHSQRWLPRCSISMNLLDLEPSRGESPSLGGLRRLIVLFMPLWSRVMVLWGLAQSQRCSYAAGEQIVWP